MKDFIIATASTADLTREYLDEHKVPFISYSYTIGDDLYEDDCREETRQETYQKMRQGAILTTSAIHIHIKSFLNLLRRMARM